MYAIELTKQAIKNLDKLPKVYYKNVRTHIDELATNPHPQGSIKMVGSENTYRLRVGVYRIVLFRKLKF